VGNLANLYAANVYLPYSFGIHEAFSTLSKRQADATMMLIILAELF